MEAPGSLPAEISKVAVRLPPFWAERPAVWFAQAEAQFALAGISSEKTKFHHVISQLNQQYTAEVEDIITSPPQQDPYTKLKTDHGSPRPSLRLSSLALAGYRTRQRSWNASTISLASWRITPPSGTISTSEIAALAPAIVAPTQGVALLTNLSLGMTLPTPTAGTTDATEIEHNVAPSPAPSTGRETSTADVSGGARHLHHSQVRWPTSHNCSSKPTSSHISAS
jgi:hypothetical protein